jgi:hypothetical protein
MAVGLCRESVAGDDDLGPASFLPAAQSDSPAKQRLLG